MTGPRTFYEVLDVSPHASESDVEAGYRRAIEVFSDDALASYALFTPDEADRVRKEIEVAYAVLRHQPTRLAYDAALAAAADKGAVTLTFITTSRPSGGTSVSDASVMTAVAGSSSSSESTKAAPQPGASSSSSTAETLPPAPTAPPSVEAPAEAGQRSSSSGRMLVIAPPVEELEASAAVPLLASAPRAEETAPPPGDPAPLPPPGPPVERATLAIPSSIPISLGPSDPPAPSAANAVTEVPAPSIPPARFKRMRVDDDTIAMSASRPVSSIAAGPPIDALDEVKLPEDGEINGSVLQRLREARGISVRTMADVTKLSGHYIKAIEANQFSDLPSRVYLRGFLIQYARALKVSPERLASGYLAFADRYRNQMR